MKRKTSSGAYIVGSPFRTPALHSVVPPFVQMSLFDYLTQGKAIKSSRINTATWVRMIHYISSSLIARFSFSNEKNDSISLGSRMVSASGPGLLNAKLHEFGEGVSLQTKVTEYHVIPKWFILANTAREVRGDFLLLSQNGLIYCQMIHFAKTKDPRGPGIGIVARYCDSDMLTMFLSRREALKTEKCLAMSGVDILHGFKRIAQGQMTHFQRRLGNFQMEESRVLNLLGLINE